MKLRLAAGFSGATVLLALVYVLVVMRPGLPVASEHLTRQIWLVESRVWWMLGCWLWLLAIFGWMVLIVTLMWSYSPAHRIETMLQSGLMVIAAVLAIGGTVIWMNVLPLVAGQPQAGDMVPVVDGLALSLLGAGLFMGSGVTTWHVVDLMRLGYLPWAWGLPALLAGISLLPSPWLLPAGGLIALGAALWAGWCFFLSTRTRMPAAYAEWS